MRLWLAYRTMLAWRRLSLWTEAKYEAAARRWTRLKLR